MAHMERSTEAEARLSLYDWFMSEKRYENQTGLFRDWRIMAWCDFVKRKNNTQCRTSNEKTTLFHLMNLELEGLKEREYVGKYEADFTYLKWRIIQEVLVEGGVVNNKLLNHLSSQFEKHLAERKILEEIGANGQEIH